MKILVDMNLFPVWISTFRQQGIEAIHWSEIGEADASDMEIFTYARENRFIVFTHDLDFGDILAATGAKSPSVIQVRTQDPVPEVLGDQLMIAIHNFQTHLEEGALITIDLFQSRARILPVKKRNNY